MAGAMDRRFQMAEQQLRRKELQREQQEKEGLKRKFASLGALGSGASIKAESQAGEAASRRMAEGSQKIEMARLGEQARQEDIEAQKAFQVSEREAGQAFQTGQFEKAQAAAEKQSLRQETLSRDLAKLSNDLQQKQIDIAGEELEMSKIVSAFNMGNAGPFREWLAERAAAKAEESGQTLNEAEGITPGQQIVAEQAGQNIADMSKIELPGELAGPAKISMFGSGGGEDIGSKMQAQAMYRRLIAAGVSPDRIQIDTRDQATGRTFNVYRKGAPAQPQPGGV